MHSPPRWALHLGTVERGWLRDRGGMLLAAVFALLAVGARADQIITGTAITLAAVGLTGTIYRQVYGSGGAGLTIPTLKSVAIPGLSQIPVLGPALFDQPAPTYLALLAMPIVWWVLFRTRLGLALRATERCGDGARGGSSHHLIRSVLRSWAAGLRTGGRQLVLLRSVVRRGDDGRRGYVAIAIVVLGRWHRVGRSRCAALGAATALQFLLQHWGSTLLSALLMLPYLLTLLALAGAVGRVRAPATWQ